jgi:hypothetical protein
MKGRRFAGDADRISMSCRQCGMGDVMDAGADAVEQVVGAHDDVGCHFRVLALGTGVGAILAVAGDVEDRAEFLLQLQGLAHQLFRAGVMVDRGQDGEGLLAGKENGRGWRMIRFRKLRSGATEKKKGRGILPRPFAEARD